MMFFFFGDLDSSLMVTYIAAIATLVVIFNTFGIQAYLKHQLNKKEKEIETKVDKIMCRKFSQMERKINFLKMNTGAIIASMKNENKKTYEVIYWYLYTISRAIEINDKKMIAGYHEKLNDSLKNITLSDCMEFNKNYNETILDTLSNVIKSLKSNKIDVTEISTQYHNIATLK